MAVTDDQLYTLREFAEQIGRDGVLADPSDGAIVGAVLDMAETHGMLTEDEWATPIGFDDLPDPQDTRDIVAAWEKGNAAWQAA